MTALTQTDLDHLRRLAGLMIPAGPDDTPGADDPAIFELVAALLHDKAAVLESLVSDLAAGGLNEASPAQWSALRERNGPAFAVVIAAVAQAYYRDDRVMRALGMEARPPFPQGYEVADGDWTLLNPVRGRTPMWRPAD